MPVPVSAHTRFPSVTGDGDDRSPFRDFSLPPPRGRFQRTFPESRSTHQSSRFEPSGTLR